MKGLRTKKVKPIEANAIAAQSREICRIAKLEIEYAKLTNLKPKGQSLLG